MNQAPEDKPQTSPAPDRAVALQYGPSDDLPKVISAGMGELARRMIAVANEHSVPVRQDPVLAKLLSELETGSPISPETYRLVAEILCFLYQTDLAWREKHPHLSQGPQCPAGPDSAPHE